MFLFCYRVVFNFLFMPKPKPITYQLDCSANLKLYQNQSNFLIKSCSSSKKQMVHAKEVAAAFMY